GMRGERGDRERGGRPGGDRDAGGKRVDPATTHRARGARLLGRLRSPRSHLARGFCDGGTRRTAGAIAWRLEVATDRAAKRRRRSSLGGFLRRLLHALPGAVILLLADPRGFAAATAQIIELGASDLAAAHELDRVDHRRIQRKHALHAFAVGNLAHGETLVEARPRTGDANAFIGLDARALALDHLDVDEDGIARRKIRDLLAGGKLCDLLFLELLNQIHGNSPSAAPIA